MTGGKNEKETESLCTGNDGGNDDDRRDDRKCICGRGRYPSERSNVYVDGWTGSGRRVERLDHHALRYRRDAADCR